MRNKIFIGLLVATIVGVVAGEYLFNRSSGAQDPAKKADKDDKKDAPPAFPPLQGQGNLFDKKDAKKDATPMFPPLETPPPTEPKVIITPPFPIPTPPKTDEKPKSETPLVPPLDPKLNEPRPIVPPVKVDVPPLPPVTTQPEQPKNTDPAFPPLAPKADKPPMPHLGTDPPIFVPPQTVKPPKTTDINDPFKTGTPPPGAKQAVDPPTVQLPLVKQPIAEEVAKIKDCPWKLHVEMVDGRTVVTATVNNKHEFKIVCQSLDLQTEKGLLKATGKVQITGAEGSASCDHLTIPLMEDRMILEGSATLSTPSMKATGEKLSLQMQSVQVGQSAPGQFSVDVNVKHAIAVVPAPGDKQWSSYGKLRNIKSVDSPANMWCLENSAGKVIAYVIPREGGSLDRFVGQTLSVLGTRESEHGGHPVLRVTHIALP